MLAGLGPASVLSDGLNLHPARQLGHNFVEADQDGWAADSCWASTIRCTRIRAHAKPSRDSLYVSHDISLKKELHSEYERSAREIVCAGLSRHHHPSGHP